MGSVLRRAFRIISIAIIIFVVILILTKIFPIVGEIIEEIRKFIFSIKEVLRNISTNLKN